LTLTCRQHEGMDWERWVWWGMTQGD
jgi:hypothetical protein